MRKAITAIATTGALGLIGAPAAQANHALTWTLNPGAQSSPAPWLVKTGECWPAADPAAGKFLKRHTFYGIQLWGNAGGHVEFYARVRRLQNYSRFVVRCTLYKATGGTIS